MTKDETKMIEDIYETLSRVSQTARTFDAVAYRLYTENCRIIADDEMVIKKSEQKQWLKDCIESNKKTEEIVRKQTAEEILQELYDEAMRTTNEVVELTAFEIKQLAKEKGIELEEN